MSDEKNKIGVVILAAGLGKRMGGTKLKVMHELHGRPLIDYVVESVTTALPEVKPVVVVCDDDLSVQNYLGDRAEYVVQTERLGTGHAVATAEPSLGDTTDHVVVLYGDMPFVTAASIQALVEKHNLRGNTLTLMTTTVPDFKDWRAGLYNYGRIIRGADGHIVRSVEKKDATPAELAITEVNPCYYCFSAPWLWKNLPRVKNNNAQGEYYLTDLIHLAIRDDELISSIAIAPEEAMGINTLDDLHIAEHLMNVV